jgi:hypothetical protein
MTDLTEDEKARIGLWHNLVHRTAEDANTHADGRLTKQERKWWLEYGEYWVAVDLALYSAMASGHPLGGREELGRRVAQCRMAMQKNIIDDLDIARTTDEKEILQARLEAVNAAFNAHLAITGIA